MKKVSLNKHVFSQISAHQLLLQLFTFRSFYNYHGTLICPQFTPDTLPLSPQGVFIKDAHLFSPWSTNREETQEKNMFETFLLLWDKT